MGILYLSDGFEPWKLFFDEEWLNKTGTIILHTLEGVRDVLQSSPIEQVGKVVLVYPLGEMLDKKSKRVAQPLQGEILRSFTIYNDRGELERVLGKKTVDDIPDIRDNMPSFIELKGHFESRATQ